MQPHPLSIDIYLDDNAVQLLYMRNHPVNTSYPKHLSVNN
jgi:hypothetical protein